MTTPNYGLNLPLDGSFNWGEAQLNINFTSIDTELGRVDVQLQQEHNTDGTHGDINADSIRVAGVILGAFDSGTATSGSTTTLTDSGREWDVNALAGSVATIKTSAGADKRTVEILSNTAEQLTFAAGTAIVSGDTFALYGVGNPTLLQTIESGNDYGFVGNIVNPMTEITGKRWDGTDFEGNYSGSAASTRATTGTAINPLTGLRESVAIDNPRFERGASGEVMIKHEGTAATNDALHSADLTNVAWVKTSCTALKDATGKDGAANSASTLTATGASATCLQTIVNASESRAYGAAIKRKTGTGTVEVTIDNGVTWVDITSNLSSTDWFDSSVVQTVTNSVFGIRLTTSGDEVEVDENQNEAGLFTSSYIPTTTLAVARGADALSLPLADNFLRNSMACTHVLDFDYDGLTTGFIGVLAMGVNATNYHLIRIDSTGKFEFRFASTLEVPTTVLSPKTAYRLVVTLDGAGAAQAYLNGILIHTWSGIIFTTDYTTNAKVPSTLNGHISYRYLDRHVTATEAGVL